MNQSRRTLLGLAGVAAVGLVGCRRGDLGGGSAEKQGSSQKQCANENEVLPVEDLMREHGVLRRILLVYEEAAHRLSAPGQGDVAPEVLTQSADLVRRFVEDYHEKLEEDFLFPRFQKAGALVELTTVLKQQHEAGRRITQQVQAVTLATLRDATSRRGLVDQLRAFVRMYRPHAAREDTVLFPALHGIVSWHEYDALGDEFEWKEKQLFGANGFADMVARVDSIERSLGIENLAEFTPPR
jgi:hemerythrin-like domain-containing protein